MGSARMSLGLFDLFSGPKGATAFWATLKPNCVGHA
jgi:hypothetical protein